MRAAVVVLLVACSTSHRKPGPRIEIESFVAAKATSVARYGPKDVPIALYLSGMGFGGACWYQLAGELRVAYQIEVAGEKKNTFVLEGYLPRDLVEDCLPDAFVPRSDIHLRKDGELLVIDVGKLGTAYAAWRDRFVIVGTRNGVLEAIAPRTPSPDWAARIYHLPETAPISATSTNPLIASLLGVPTEDYDIIFDHVDRTAPGFRGRIVVRYATPEDAQAAQARFLQNDFHLDLPASVLAAVAKMTSEVTDTTLELGFDPAMFEVLTSQR